MNQPQEISADELTQYFNGKQIENLRTLTGGNSGAYMVRFDVDNKPYVARRSGGIKGKEAIEQEFAIQQKAASLGIAPPIVTIDLPRSLMIMSYVESVIPPQLSPHPEYQTPAQKEKVLALLRKLHTMPPPKTTIKQVNHAKATQQIRESIAPHVLSDEINQTLDKVASYHWPEDTNTIAHMDFHFANFLYDGNKIFVIDWELAGLAHPFVDVADFANSNFCSRSEGDTLLSEYLQRAPDHQEVVLFNTLRHMILAFRAVFAFSFINPDEFSYHADVVNDLNMIPYQNLKEAYAAFDAGKFDPRSVYHWFQLGSIFIQEIHKLDTGEF